MIFDLLDAIEGIIGVLLGFILGRRERNLRAPILYRCECTHSLAMHHAPVGYCRKGNCACAQYVGPIPAALDSDL